MLIIDLFRLSPAPYVHACTSPRAPWMVSAFVVLTGIVYGVLTALFQREAGGEIAGIPIADVPLYILVVGNVAGGLLIAVAVHVGITVIAWMMAKAIGGPGLLVGIYRATAYLLPFTWLALPFLAQYGMSQSQPDAQVGFGPGAYAAALLGLALFLAGLYQIYLLTQERGPRRSAFGVLLFVLFTGSVLYLVGA